MFVCPSVRQSYVRPPVRPFSFLEDILSKHQCIFTKLGICIDIVEIWFGIANGQISSFLTELSVRDTTVAEYYSLTLFYLIMKLYVVCTHNNRLVEAILISTLNIQLLRSKSKRFP